MPPSPLPLEVSSPSGLTATAAIRLVSEPRQAVCCDNCSANYAARTPQELVAQAADRVELGKWAGAGITPPGAAGRRPRACELVIPTGPSVGGFASSRTRIPPTGIFRNRGFLTENWSEKIPPGFFDRLRASACLTRIEQRAWAARQRLLDSGRCGR